MTIYEYANFGNINEKQTAGCDDDVSQYCIPLYVPWRKSDNDDSYQDEAVREEDWHADHQDDRPQQDHRQDRVGLSPEQQQYFSYQIFFKWQQIF